MRPLLFLIPFIIAVTHGKPSGSYSYPAPTPSAAPGLLPSLSTPSPSIASSINLQPPSASIAPEIYNLASPTASLAPSVLNLPSPTPSIASSLYDNVLGAGQYGAPIVNIGGPSLGIQPLGLQSLGIPAFGDQHLGLGLSAQYGFPFAGNGLGFGSNLGGSLFNIGSPQLSVGSLPQLSPTPIPDITSASVGPTISTIGVQRPSVHTTGGVIVQKHVYVHVAPEEPEEIPRQRQVIVPPPRRNYKIIFIKAPAPPAPTPEIIPPLPQDEERTVVYVLVKKPEEQPDIKIETPPPTAPAKPEVYFIRYNTRKESLATGAIPSGPVPVSGSGSISIVEDVIKGTTPSAIGDPTVALNLNQATLDGGSALSLAVTGSPLEGGLQVSSTPAPVYGPPRHK